MVLNIRARVLSHLHQLCDDTNPQASISLLGQHTVVVTFWKPRSVWRLHALGAGLRYDSQPQHHSHFFMDLLMVIENLISEVYAKYACIHSYVTLELFVCV